MEARASAEAQDATRAGIVMGGRDACMQGAAARKASCLAESGVVQPGLHTRYMWVHAARLQLARACGEGVAAVGGGDLPCCLMAAALAPRAVRVCPVAVVYPV